MYIVFFQKQRPTFGTIPWSQVGKSVPVWAVIISHFTFNWCLYVLLTGLPIYFKDVLGFDMKSVRKLMQFMKLWASALTLDLHVTAVIAQTEKAPASSAAVMQLFVTTTHVRFHSFSEWSCFGLAIFMPRYHPDPVRQNC